MRRGKTGRAVSATIHGRLQEALLQGEPKTYAQLATHAGCTVRSVRNYLERSQEIFGFRVEQTRAPGSHSVLVRAAGRALAARGSCPAFAQGLASAVRDRLFHLEHAGGSLGDRSAPIIASFRGIPSYNPDQERLLDGWVGACTKAPRLAVRLRCPGLEPPECTLWPLATILHNLEGLLLVGLPIEADSLDAVRVVNLERVSTEPGGLQVAQRNETGDPAVDLDAVDVYELIDLPFSARPLRQDGRATVDVHVRFEPEVADRMRNRLWHRSQEAVLRTDGSLDVKFGPVDLDVAASWASSFGGAAQVMGSKKLRKTVKKGRFTP
jgi:hypothetical protein